MTLFYRQVLEGEAVELAISVWRQVIFESMAYAEGLHTERMMVDSEHSGLRGL